MTRRYVIPVVTAAAVAAAVTLNAAVVADPAACSAA
jgi:hypothetical protein